MSQRVEDGTLTPDPAALDFPTAADGVVGLAFITAALASQGAGGSWAKVEE